MAIIELSIQNPYATKAIRENRKPTSFSRSFRHLSMGKNPGKVVPIIMNIEDDWKTFGVLTINTGGSVSFFPDFFNLDNFDHLTLSKDFIKSKGHLTVVGDSGKHKKVMNIEASPLSHDNIYHLITFGMQDSDLLMDSPAEIQLPKIQYRQISEQKKYHEWIYQAVTWGSCILDFPISEGSYFVQILVLPKGQGNVQPAVALDIVEKLFTASISLENSVINCKVTPILTPDNCDFKLCILTFRVYEKLSSPFAFIMATQ